MMEKLKPCPYCGGDAWIYNTNTVFVECKSCHASGPYMKTTQAAIAAWNAMPSPLRWTKEPPTDPGWYWFRNEEVEGILQICNSVKGLYIMYHGNDEEWDLPEGEWAGPIQEPVE